MANQQVVVPVWAISAPPHEWIDEELVPERTWSRAWGQFILYRLLLFSLIYYAVLWLPCHIDPEWPYSWHHYVGMYLLLGALCGVGVIDHLPFHHMMALGDVVNMKLRALVTWPYFYLKLSVIFFIHAWL